MANKSYGNFEHPIISRKIEDSIAKQLHEDISLYDNGGIYKEIETKLKKLFPAKYILSVCNGTSALYSMYKGAGISRGDQVLVPAYTFFATATPLFQIGAVPVLVDTGPDGNIDPSAIDNAITKWTKAVVITHMWGIPCDLESIARICKERGILLFEDCSHAHGATYKGKVVGTAYSNAAAWSLQGKKLLTSGEGGFMATNSQEMFERAVLLGHFNKRAKQDVTLEKLIPYQVTGIGGNLRMHPLGAAILRPQLDSFEQQLKERRETAKILQDTIRQIDGLYNITYPSYVEPAWYAFPFRFEKSKFVVSINVFLSAIKKAGAIEADIPGSTRPMNKYKIFVDPSDVLPEYRQYRKLMTSNNKTFVGAESFHSSMVKLPTWYGPDRYKYASFYADTLIKVAKKYKKRRK